MSRPLRVRVCDDDKSRVQEWADRIQEVLGDRADVMALPPVAFANAVAALKHRKTRAKAEPEASESDDARIFDEADVVILDSDLTPDPDARGGEDPEDAISTHLAGEMGGEVAHLIRTYTSAAALVVVNQLWKTRTFDLTMMKFAFEVADAYICEEDVDNPRLWGLAGAEEFSPWHWPQLTTLAVQIRWARQHFSLDSNVLVSLGLDGPRHRGAFHERQLEVLGVDVDLVSDVTFRDLASGGEFGLRPKEQTSDQHLLSVAVCVARRWIERLVLPSQNVLVDLPHLLQHNPWLTVSRSDLAEWNNRSRWWSLDSPQLAGDAYNSSVSQLLGRPVWNTPELPSRPSGERVRPSDPVFCEDSATFSTVAEAIDFVSDIEGGYSQRFVTSVAGVEYTPKNRLLT